MIEHSTLTLVQSTNFAMANVDFYQDVQDIWMTREQIGAALEYSEPHVAMAKIHERHQERLDRFSTVARLARVEGGRLVERESYLYSAKGVYEICRWSQQPKADGFFDWVYDRIEELRTRVPYANSPSLTRSTTLKYLADTIKATTKALPRDVDTWPLVRAAYQAAGITVPETLAVVTPASQQSQNLADQLRNLLLSVQERIVGWKAPEPWRTGNLGIVKHAQGHTYVACDPRWIKANIAGHTLRQLSPWIYPDRGGFARVTKITAKRTARLIWIDVAGAGIDLSGCNAEQQS